MCARVAGKLDLLSFGGAVSRKARRLAACLSALAALGASLPVAQAQLRRDPDAVTVSSAAADQSTWTHLVPAGVDRYLIVGLTVGGVPAPVPTVRSLTCNGAALQPLGSIAHSSGLRVELWGLADPAVGPQTIALQLASPAAFVAGSVSFAGVDPVAPTGPVATGEGEGPVASVTVVSVQGTQILDVYGSLQATPTVGQAQTVNWNDRTTLTGASSSRAGANSVTMSWNHGGGTQSWAQIAVSLHARASTVPAEPGPVDPGRVDAASPDAADGSDAGAPAPIDADPWLPDAGPPPPEPAMDASSELGADPDAGPPGDARADGGVTARRQLDLGCACSLGRPDGHGSGCAPALVALAATLARRASRRRRR